MIITFGVNTAGSCVWDAADCGLLTSNLGVLIRDFQHSEAGLACSR